jgi:hypothetical protein
MIPDGWRASAPEPEKSVAVLNLGCHPAKPENGFAFFYKTMPSLTFPNGFAIAGLPHRGGPLASGMPGVKMQPVLTPAVCYSEKRR